MKPPEQNNAANYWERRKTPPCHKGKESVQILDELQGVSAYAAHKWDLSLLQIHTKVSPSPGSIPVSKSY